MALKKVDLRVPNVHKDLLELHDIESAVRKITKLQVRTKSRRREYVMARQLFFYLASHYTTASVTAMAKHINQNHANVIHHLKNIPYLIGQDAEMKDWYHFVVDHLNSLVNIRIDRKDNNVYTKNVLEKVEWLLEENKRINDLITKYIEVNEHKEI